MALQEVEKLVQVWNVFEKSLSLTLLAKMSNKNSAASSNQ